ncbi:MAG: hypothetical protein IKX18_00950 [Muribaculaceae bacterium]|nr:hypothetical protein [Muribaculaceae bacterium]
MKKFIFLFIGLAFAVNAYSQTTLPKPANPTISEWLDAGILSDFSFTLGCNLDEEPVADDYPGIAEEIDATYIHPHEIVYTILDADKVTYSVYTDNDEVFTFTPELFPSDLELFPNGEGVTQIPFNYDGIDIYGKWYMMIPLTNKPEYLEEGQEPYFTWRIGVQTIYTDNGQTSTSDIVYMEIYPQMQEAKEITSTSFLADWSCNAENTYTRSNFDGYVLYVINKATQDTVLVQNVEPTHPQSEINEQGVSVGVDYPIPGATYTVEGLTPGETYEFYVVQKHNKGVLNYTQSVVREVTLPGNNVYVLGQINDQNWAPNAGTMMEYDAEKKVYTGTYNLEANESFGFTTELAMYDDQGSWDYIEQFRFGPVSSGDFELQDQYIGQPLTLTFDNYGAIKVLSAGEYKVTVSLEGNGYIIVDKVTPEPPAGLRGDVNDDKVVDITDATMLINFLLSGDATGINMVNANCDLQGNVDISDATTLINFLLNGTWPD